MPSSKRRTSGGPTAAAKAKAKSQSTLAFHGKSNKVTKAGANAPTNKSKKDPTLLNIEPVNLTVEADPDLEEPTTAELSIVEQVQADAREPLTPEEEAAGKVKEAQIKKYWREKEAARKAPRVHQEDLSLHEKVCREFDTDGRYGVSFDFFWSCKF
jgi:DNA polymerase delta subunit 4